MNCNIWRFNYDCRNRHRAKGLARMEEQRLVTIGMALWWLLLRVVMGSLRLSCRHIMNFLQSSLPWVLYNEMAWTWTGSKLSSKESGKVEEFRPFHRTKHQDCIPKVLTSRVSSSLLQEVWRENRRSSKNKRTKWVHHRKTATSTYCHRSKWLLSTQSRDSFTIIHKTWARKDKEVQL